MMRTCGMTIPRARLAEQGGEREKEEEKKHKEHTGGGKGRCLKGRSGFAAGGGRGVERRGSPVSSCVLDGIIYRL